MESGQSTFDDKQKGLAQILIEDVGMMRIMMAIGFVALTPVLQAFVLQNQWAFAATIPLITGFTGMIGWYQIWLVRKKKEWNQTSILQMLMIGLCVAFVCIAIYAAGCSIAPNAQGCGEDGLRSIAIANIGAVTLFALLLWIRSSKIKAGMSNMEDRAKQGQKLL
jgi:uncharacterized membrane protein YidH (DUF202 family)